MVAAEQRKIVIQICQYVGGHIGNVDDFNFPALNYVTPAQLEYR